MALCPGLMGLVSSDLELGKFQFAFVRVGHRGFRLGYLHPLRLQVPCAHGHKQPPVQQFEHFVGMPLAMFTAAIPTLAMGGFVKATCLCLTNARQHALVFSGALKRNVIQMFSCACEWFGIFVSTFDAVAMSQF